MISHLLKNQFQISHYYNDITETWLDESDTDSEAEIHGYMSLRRDRKRECGGVCVYIRGDIAFNARNDIGGDLSAQD